MILRRRDAISTIKNRYVIRSNKKRKNCPQHLLTQHTHDRESDGTSAVEILIAISHRYRRQPIFPWWSVEVRGKKRKIEREIFEARFAVPWLWFLIVKMSGCLFSGEREWKSRNDIHHGYSCACYTLRGTERRSRSDGEPVPLPLSTVTRGVISVLRMGWEISFIWY